jgi:hypothetical protein
LLAKDSSGTNENARGNSAGVGRNLYNVYQKVAEKWPFCVHQ